MATCSASAGDSSPKSSSLSVVEIDLLKLKTIGNKQPVQPTTRKEDISNEITMGTFLTSLDTDNASGCSEERFILYSLSQRQDASRPREGTIPPELSGSTEHQPHFCPS